MVDFETKFKFVFNYKGDENGSDQYFKSEWEEQEVSNFLGDDTISYYWFLLKDEICDWFKEMNINYDVYHIYLDIEDEYFIIITFDKESDLFLFKLTWG